MVGEIPVEKEGHRMNLFYKVARGMIRLYSHVMLNMDVLWHGEMPVGPKIYVANHPSATDPFVLHLLSHEPMSVMIVSTAFAFPLFGEYIRRAGQIQVSPGEGARAMEQAKEFLKAGYSVGIFPEGGFSPQTGGFRQPRSGAARLALSTGVPIIPVGIYLPRERSLRISSHLNGKPTLGYWYLHGPYGITIGKPVKLEGEPTNPEHVQSQSRTIMGWIKSLAQESEFRVRRLASVPVRY
jgi:1-acyl-sn-glycerol-3-phosphate acyltransferase